MFTLVSYLVVITVAVIDSSTCIALTVWMNVVELVGRIKQGRVHKECHDDGPRMRENGDD